MKNYYVNSKKKRRNNRTTKKNARVMHTPTTTTSSSSICRNNNPTSYQQHGHLPSTPNLRRSYPQFETDYYNRFTTTASNTNSITRDRQSKKKVGSFIQQHFFKRFHSSFRDVTLLLYSVLVCIFLSAKKKLKLFFLYKKN